MPSDPEVATLYGDSLWAAGLFDESDELYQAALELNPQSSRARFGHARSIATRNRLGEALNALLRQVTASFLVVAHFHTRRCRHASRRFKSSPTPAAACIDGACSYHSLSEVYRARKFYN